MYLEGSTEQWGGGWGQLALRLAAFFITARPRGSEGLFTGLNSLCSVALIGTLRCAPAPGAAPCFIHDKNH